jgi:hypothetical protein
MYLLASLEPLSLNLDHTQKLTSTASVTNYPTFPAQTCQRLGSQKQLVGKDLSDVAK